MYSIQPSVALGGVWAKFEERNVEQARRIQELEARTRVQSAQIRSQDDEMALLRDTLQERDAQLRAATEHGLDLAVRLDKALHSRDAAKAEAWEASSSRTAEIAELAQEKLALFARARDLEGSLVVTLAARDMAVRDMEGLAEECTHVTESLQRAEDELKGAKARASKLETRLENSERQREQHMAHSELLLKEKNRLFDQVAALRRRADDISGGSSIEITPEKPVDKRPPSSKGTHVAFGTVYPGPAPKSKVQLAFEGG
eukprot:CAMPEP_0182882560 /NCGR_PEP_ID=MMETSP0034_2-20130328/17857_1 /TAXON_ID=156128 /ORGANISM="Nephroselmis pyriformis, Strain CCMP717" /LENGTH=258 /DNA_ID=CAMNT_0025015661 /DNA_START=45 /DNA_END=817 /DNA_ORIENTATION=+